MTDFAPAPLDLEHIVVHGETALRGLRRERIFITGGTGFFGRWLLAGLAHANARLDLGLQLTVLARQPELFVTSNPVLGRAPLLTWLKGDVRDFTFPPGRFGHVIHAATSSLATDAPRVLFDTILDGTRRVADFARAAGVSNLLFVSSGAVYGAQPPALERVGEDYRGAPDSTSIDAAYGEGKRAAELALTMAARDGGFAPKIARCFAFLGPGLPLDAHFAAGNFLRDALRGDEINVASDGTATRSYLYPADLVVWLVTILAHGLPLHPYNVGSDAIVSVADLAAAIGRHAHVGYRVQKAPGTSPPHSYVPDISRSRLELGLDVWIDLDDAIVRTLSWHRHLAHPPATPTGTDRRGTAQTHF
jgi:nucleoside-diphosphate-sugar epimerase